MKRELLEQRAKYRRLLRKFFEERDFLEVLTPLLVVNPGLEPNIQYFETEFKPLMGKGAAATYYLPTSPEYHLKKALSWGLPKIFELTRAFRNGELGKQHVPEFEILEWYRQPGTYEDIANDVEELLTLLWKSFHEGSLTFKHKKVQEVFLEFDLDLVEAQRDVLSFRQKLAHFSVETNPEDSFEDLFHRAFLQLVEPKMTEQRSQDEILFLWDFPAPLRALSKLSDDKFFCKRFEVYWGSVELGNAFDELVDPVELRSVCEADRKKRIDRYAKSPPLDEEFLQAHKSLHSQMGGIAMGLDRIFQWLRGVDSVKEIMLFEGIK